MGDHLSAVATSLFTFNVLVGLLLVVIGARAFVRRPVLDQWLSGKDLSQIDVGEVASSFIIGGAGGKLLSKIAPTRSGKGYLIAITSTDHVIRMNPLVYANPAEVLAFIEQRTTRRAAG